VISDSPERIHPSSKKLHQQSTKIIIIIIIIIIINISDLDIISVDPGLIKPDNYHPPLIINIYLSFATYIQN
jgi:hypothetical protein